jgi:hypothetical protein
MEKQASTVPRPEPTPYSDVNAVLHELLSSIQAILGDHFQGMYLDGSSRYTAKERSGH